MLQVVQYARIYDPDTPAQHHTLDNQLLVGCTTATLVIPNYYMIYIWCPICFMSIAILCPILIYPFLPPSAKMCAHAPVLQG